jgi:hypothetical protein
VEVKQSTPTHHGNNMACREAQETKPQHMNDLALEGKYYCEYY